MDRIVHVDNGRNYDAWKNEEGQVIIIGPPDVVDDLGLPEPTATNLHNALHRRKILNYRDATLHAKDLQGALNEALMLDLQRLHEAYYRYEQELEIS